MTNKIFLSFYSENGCVCLQSFGLVSKNPVLKNITDYLIEEASAEEEELLGHTADQEEGQLGDDTATVERDEALIKVCHSFKKTHLNAN